MNGARALVALFPLLALLAAAPTRPVRAQAADASIDAFLEAAVDDDDRRDAALGEIASHWRDGYAALLVDLIDLVERTRFYNAGTFGSTRRLYSFLEDETGQRFGSDLDAWRRWVWSLPYDPHPDYLAFKAKLYARLDRRFAVFFRDGMKSSIRLDEIQWGGVGVNGIPPLENSIFIAADEADYLDDGDIVFGLAIDGDVRAYPKRILAWHEMALDHIGSHDVAVVYCTLCGTVIPYDTNVGGRKLRFGTSGFLYQSNKLMFDAETGSLWSSLTGEPVVGTILDLGLRLDALPVVTTTWGEWRAQHPDTTVLSLETGFRRDYSEGAAYRDYFGTDALMFDVTRHDPRLANKAEVLVPDVRKAADPGPLAISTGLLDREPVYTFTADGENYVVITSPGGANRVYAAADRHFVATDGVGSVVDSEGGRWTLSEAALTADADTGLRLPRVVAHRSFWFAWYAQHPDTLLLQ